METNKWRCEGCQLSIHGIVFLLLNLLLSIPVSAQSQTEHLVLDNSSVKPFVSKTDKLHVKLVLSAYPHTVRIADYSVVISIDQHELATYTATDWGAITYSAMEKVIALPLPQNLALGEHQLTISMRRHVGGSTIEDHQLNTTIRVYDEIKPRQKFLVEHFTAIWCPHCPQTERALADVTKHHADVAWVSIHCDSQYEVEGTYMLRSINRLKGYPSVFVDRRFIEEVQGWRMGMAKVNPSFPSKEIADEHYPRISNSPIPSLVAIEVVPEYNAKTRMLNLRVDLESVSEFEKIFGTSALTVLLVEDSVPNLHDNILRKVITHAAGDPIEWNGNTYSKSYSTLLNPNWNAKQVKVVAYVARQLDSNNPATDMYARYVTNTEQKHILPPFTTSVLRLDKEAVQSVGRYDALGRKIDAPVEGLNILRYANGRVEKVWVK